MNVDFFRKNGYLHLPEFFQADQVLDIKKECVDIFKNILAEKSLISNKKINESEFNQSLYRLFNTDLTTLQNTGKQLQHLISLHLLSLDKKIVKLLRELGLSHPVISTRPVLFFNHPALAKEKHYHTVDAHQDWRSMQGSLNSIVIWVPLMDINEDLGALKIIPGSHLWGLMSPELKHGFGFTSLTKEQLAKFVSVPVKAGDILAFSSFLIHESGDNITDEPRWSCHFRYNDLNEKTFIKRGYPHAYIYKPTEDLITPDFPSQDELKKIFE